MAITRDVLDLEQSMEYDIVIKGGTVIDPSQGIHAELDVGITAGKVTGLERSLGVGNARDVIEAAGLIVTPGLIDLHTHVWWGVAHLAVEADSVSVQRGVTTAIDAGSAGANTMPGFQRYVIDAARTRVLAFLHISGMGQLDNEIGELEDIRWARVEHAVEIARQYPETIVGIKVRLSRPILGTNDLVALERALAAGELLDKPVMIHIGDTANPVERYLEQLRPGDIVTHSFTGRPRGILDSDGKVIDVALDAMDRGVVFDVGHGAGSFSFDVAEKFAEQGYSPGTVSSDVHKYNVNGPVFDLATTLTKYLHLGYDLADVVSFATRNPAAAVSLSDRLGTLKVGAEADVSLLRLDTGSYELMDAEGATRTASRMLVPVETIRAGRRVSLNNATHRLAHAHGVGHRH